VRGFSLTVEQMAPNVLRVALSGELDLTRTLLLDSELQAVEARHPEAVIIDLRRLDFVDSSGIARLLGARRRAARGGWQLLIVRGSEAVQRIMSLAAVDRALRFVDDPYEALAVVGAAT
jgi:anti-anti-sigma factor